MHLGSVSGEMCVCVWVDVCTGVCVRVCECGWKTRRVLVIFCFYLTCELFLKRGVILRNEKRGMGFCLLLWNQCSEIFC